jgi:hypothetical protein
VFGLPTAGLVLLPVVPAGLVVELVGALEVLPLEPAALPAPAPPPALPAPMVHDASFKEADQIATGT